MKSRTSIPTPTVTSTWTLSEKREKAVLIHQGVCDCRGEMTCAGGRRWAQAAVVAGGAR